MRRSHQYRTDPSCRCLCPASCRMCACICPGWRQKCRSRPSTQNETRTHVKRRLRNYFPTYFCANIWMAWCVEELPCRSHTPVTSSWFPRSAARRPALWSLGWLPCRSCIRSGSSLCGCRRWAAWQSIGCCSPRPSRNLRAIGDAKAIHHSIMNKQGRPDTLFSLPIWYWHFSLKFRVSNCGYLTTGIFSVLCFLI